MNQPQCFAANQKQTKDEIDLIDYFFGLTKNRNKILHLKYIYCCHKYKQPQINKYSVLLQYKKKNKICISVFRLFLLFCVRAAERRLSYAERRKHSQILVVFIYRFRLLGNGLQRHKTGDDQTSVIYYILKLN